MRFLNLCLILLMFTYTSGFNVLGLFPHKGKSHYGAYESLMKTLVTKGHHVTVMSHFPQRKPLENFTDIDISGGDGFMNEINLADITGSRLQRHMTPLLLAYFGYVTCSETLPHAKFKKFANIGHHVDVIIVELFNTECFLSALNQYQAPIIGISSAAIMPWDDFTVGVPSNPAYIPNSFMPFSDTMTFLERFENTISYIFCGGVFQFLIDIPGRIVASGYFSDNLPNLKGIAANISLMLVNNHFSLTFPRPLPPSYIEVGGIHVGRLNKPPMHLDKWINESEHGVIYFSLGSMIKGHTFPEEKKQMFINVFNRLPQRVLWKWENETMSGKTDNIMIEKWMPQFDILCHPNVKVFIAHGGMLGVTEAVHCGVPMVIMPQFGDQFTNAKAVEANGGGVILDYRYLDEESIYNSLTTALDPKFNKKAKELSARFKDRPLPPLETAIYWIEYVARHGGAPHLKTAAVGMPLYQYLLLDVIAFLAVIFFSVIFIVYYISRAILKKLCGCRQSAQKLKKN